MIKIINNIDKSYILFFESNITTNIIIKINYIRSSYIINFIDILLIIISILTNILQPI